LIQNAGAATARPAFRELHKTLARWRSLRDVAMRDRVCANERSRTSSGRRSATSPLARYAACAHCAAGADPPDAMRFSTHQVKRYGEIARLAWRYGRGDLARGMRSDDFAVDDEPKVDGRNPQPEQLADDLEAMGPTFIKLGQILSGRPDLLPEPYLRALSRLQDKVKPFAFDDVERTIVNELGVRISKAFAKFDPTPLAAASLGQVHLAALRDGRAVVVKVQRPGIQKQIAEDFDVLERIATLLDAHTEIGRRYRFTSVLEEFRDTIRDELDYQREAQNLVSLGEHLKEFELLRIPQPISSYCTRSVLTMERVHGHKITALSPAANVGLDGARLAEELVQAYLKQVLVDGLFHADPHPGNVFLTDEGKLALLDLGMVGHTSPEMQENLLKLLLAISDGKSEHAADVVIGISEKTNDFDPIEFRRRIAHLLAARQEQSLAQMNVGRSLLEVSKNAINNGLVVPSELTLLGKTLIQLDTIGRVLAPSFNPNESIRQNVGKIAARRMMKDSAQGSLFTSLMETKAFLLALPARIGKILESVAANEIELKVRALDAELFVQGVEKIANRITIGLVLSALIVGAALLMHVDTPFRLFGYPGFAMICFLIAAVSGFSLVAATVIKDHRQRQKRL
jgi:predicted unusual protein kinase regulating ubiquinone biosynthesis (AarF/ABC1/UbiB family)